MVAANKEEEGKLQQQAAVMVKAAVAKVAQSDIVKRYFSEQQRFLNGEARDDADPAPRGEDGHSTPATSPSVLERGSAATTVPLNRYVPGAGIVA